MSLSKRTVLLLGLAALAPTLVSCASVKPITAERPKDEVCRTELKREMSSLNVPIEASTADIARKLNQMIGREIYKGSTKYQGLTADILRNGPMAVNAANNYLYLTVPIAMTLRYGMFETPTVTSNLKFKLGARVTPDWKLNAEIYYMGLSDQLADKIWIGPFSFKPRSIIEGITQPVQRALSAAISNVINDKYPLRTQISKAWLAAQKPVLLNKDYNAWLEITPREVMLCPLYAQNNQVRLSFGLKTFAELVVGPEPAARPLIPLPHLELVNSVDRNFRIALNADLFYRDILRIASPLLINKKFESGGKNIVIKDIDIYGNGDKLVIKVATSGSLNGDFYLTGRPRFDPQTNMLSVEDVDFDLNTKDFLVQSAAWLLHGAIRSTIQEKLKMDMTPQLEQSREMARKAMARVQLADNVFLKGTVKEIKLNDVMVQKDKISLQVYTEGETAIVFQ